MATNCEMCGGAGDWVSPRAALLLWWRADAWYAEERKQALAWFRGLGDDA